MTACSPQRFLANNRNLLRTAALTASSVLPADNQVLRIPFARRGTAQVLLTGSYTGAEEATYDVEIVDSAIENPLISTPVFNGVGSGTLTDISSERAAQSYSLECADAGVDAAAAGVIVEGVPIVARSSGTPGNLIHLTVDQGGTVLVDHFLDTFTGSGDLSTHAPDVGGAYVLSSTGSIADYVLNGSGGLPSQSITTHDAASPISDPGDTWTFSVDFTVTAAGADHLEWELATEKAGNTFDIEAYFEWDGATWQLDCTVGAFDSGSIDVTSLLTVGVPHTFSIEVSPTGTVYKLDGVTKATTATVAATPIRAMFENWKGGAGSNVTFDSVSLASETFVGMEFTPAGFSLLADLPAGSGGASAPMVGQGFDWDCAVLDANNQIPAGAHRVAFGDDRTVYLSYKQWTGAQWEYHLVPALGRTVPRGTQIQFVTGGRTVSITDGTTTEIYSDVETAYDLLNDIKTLSALVDVGSAASVTNDRSPTGQAARELTLRTDAHTEPSSGSGSKFATSLTDVSVDPSAGTEIVTFTCIAVTGADFPTAALGASIWAVEGSLSGVLPNATEGVPYLTTKFGATIPQRFPPGYGTQRGNFGVDSINYASRGVGEIEPQICFIPAPLGPNAIDDTILLTYKTKPSDSCKCTDMPAPSFSATCLGTLTGESAMAYSTDARTRLEALYDFASTIAAAVTQYIAGTAKDGIPETTKTFTAPNSTSSASSTDRLGGTTAGSEANEGGFEFPIDITLIATTFADFGLPADFQSLIDTFEQAIILLDKLDPGADKTAGWDKWDEALAAAVADLTDVRYHDVATEKYKIMLRKALAYAGLSPLGKSDASAIAGDGCWQDYRDPAWWTVVGNVGGAYAPAFSNHPYYSSRQSSSGAYYSTKQFGFQLNIKCASSLKDGDQIILKIGNASWGATYQVSDILYLPIIAGAPLYLTGGRDASPLQNWYLTGSVEGPLPPYAFDPTAPAAYSITGLTFLLSVGGIEYAKGDRWRWSVEGGHYHWRKDGGAWQNDSPQQAIPLAPELLDAGLSASFLTGAAASFVTGDMFRFRALQPRAVSNLLTPTSAVWQWSGASATLLCDLGSSQPMTMVALLHSLPEGAALTLDGGATSAVSDWTESITWRADAIWQSIGREARWVRLSFANATGGALQWAWIGTPLAMSRGADFVPVRSYSIKRANAGLVQGGRSLGKSVSGTMTWGESAGNLLSEADVIGLSEMLDYVKDHDDEPILAVPQITRVDEAALFARINADEIDLPDVFGYQPNFGYARKLSASIPLSGVWR